MTSEIQKLTTVVSRLYNGIPNIHKFIKMSEYSMRLRSKVTPEEKEEQKQQKIREEKERLNRPFIEYKGKIHYITDFVDIASTCDELIKLADESFDHLILGFDLEWPFSFKTGSGKVAIIQISPDLDRCYIFEVSKIKSLPRGISILLSHPKVRITGVNIKNDIRKLARDFKVLFEEKIIDNCIDSGVFANEVLPLTQRWSMEKLVAYLLKMKINKDKNVRMSQWHVSPLTKTQLEYAATDAYASLLLYMKLKLKQKEQKVENKI